jgi:ubiquinone/menaquinone biosynthesis C-methylase UbiE
VSAAEEFAPQREAFLDGEGNNWFRRNPLDLDQQMSDPWNKRLAALLGENDRILEIGCADGRRVHAICQISGRAVRAYGVDPSLEAISAGKSKFPELELRVGTADQTGLEGSFDLILMGFFLYLCDRSTVFAAVAEADRLLRDGGFLAVIDFDPPSPSKRPYHHLPGLWSYKMDYSKLFLAAPWFQLLEKHSLDLNRVGNWQDVAPPGDRVALTILRRSIAEAFVPSDLLEREGVFGRIEI